MRRTPTASRASRASSRKSRSRPQVVRAIRYRKTFGIHTVPSCRRYGCNASANSLSTCAWSVATIAASKSPVDSSPVRRSRHRRTRRARHPPRAVRPEARAVGDLLQVVAQHRARAARAAQRVRQPGGHPQHGRGRAALRRTPARQHHGRPACGERGRGVEHVAEPLRVARETPDGLERGHQGVRGRLRAGRVPGGAVDESGVRTRAWGPGGRQQPFPGEGQAFGGEALDTGDRRASGGRRQQGEPGAAAEAEQPGAGSHFQSLVDRFVERHQHPLLDLGPVTRACTQVHARRRPRMRQVLPHERRCHGKRPNPPRDVTVPVSEAPVMCARTSPVCQQTPHALPRPGVVGPGLWLPCASGENSHDGNVGPYHRAMAKAPVLTPRADDFPAGTRI